VLAWLSVCSEVQTCMWPSWCHCHSLSHASVKSRLVLPFWYRLTRGVTEKGPLNVCVCVCVVQNKAISDKRCDISSALLPVFVEWNITGTKSTKIPEVPHPSFPWRKNAGMWVGRSVPSSNISMRVSSLSVSLSIMMMATAPASSAIIVFVRNEQSLKTQTASLLSMKHDRRTVTQRRQWSNDLLQKVFAKQPINSNHGNCNTL